MNDKQKIEMALSAMTVPECKDESKRAYRIRAAHCMELPLIGYVDVLDFDTETESSFIKRGTRWNKEKEDCTTDKKVIYGQWYEHIDLCRRQWEATYPVALNECRKALGSPTVEPSIESIVAEIQRLKTKLKNMVEGW
jgi:hypothetical protein